MHRNRGESVQPIILITKSALIVRDLDLLGPMAADHLVHANISITTLNPALGHGTSPFNAGRATSDDT